MPKLNAQMATTVLIRSINPMFPPLYIFSTHILKADIMADCKIVTIPNPIIYPRTISYLLIGVASNLSKVPVVRSRELPTS